MDDNETETAAEEAAEVCPVHGVAHDLEPEWTEEDERNAEFDARWRP